MARGKRKKKHGICMLSARPSLCHDWDVGLTRFVVSRLHGPLEEDHGPLRVACALSVLIAMSACDSGREWILAASYLRYNRKLVWYWFVGQRTAIKLVPTS
eukprot:5570398-Amphidinium_carterae.1